MYRFKLIILSLFLGLSASAQRAWVGTCTNDGFMMTDTSQYGSPNPTLIPMPEVVNMTKQGVTIRSGDDSRSYYFKFAEMSNYDALTIEDAVNACNDEQWCYEFAQKACLVIDSLGALRYGDGTLIGVVGDTSGATGIVSLTFSGTDLTIEDAVGTHVVNLGSDSLVTKQDLVDAIVTNSSLTYDENTGLFTLTDTDLNTVSVNTGINDSLAAQRLDITANYDDITDIYDSLAVHRVELDDLADSLNAHRLQIDINTGAIAALQASGGAVVLDTSQFISAMDLVNGDTLQDVFNWIDQSMTWEANRINFLPTGDLVSTDVQAAIIEQRDDRDALLAAKVDTLEYNAFVTSITNGIIADTFSTRSSLSDSLAGLQVHPDGTRFYTSRSGTDQIFQNTIVPAHKVSSASGASTDFNVNAGFFMAGLGMSPDGNHTLASVSYNSGGSYSVFRHEPTTPYTIDFDEDTGPSRTALVLANGEHIPVIFWKRTGGNWYGINTSSEIVQYDTNGDYEPDDTGEQVLLLAATPDVIAANWSWDGTQLWTSTTGSTKLYVYTTPTAWDITGLTYSFSVETSNTLGNIVGLEFVDGGSKLYILSQTGIEVFNIGANGGAISQLQEDVGAVEDSIDVHRADISALQSDVTDLQNNSLPATGVRDLDNGFDLTIATDSIQIEEDLDELDAIAYDSSDVIKVYQGTDLFGNYTTPLTENDDGGASVSAPIGFSLKADGTQYWLHFEGQDDVYEYTMSTPFDPSTATQTDTEDIGNTSINGGEMAGDGSVYIYGEIASGTTVGGRSLSTPFDISTDSDAGTNAYTASNRFIQEVIWADDGNSYYAVTGFGDLVQFSTSSAWNFTDSDTQVGTFNLFGSMPSVHAGAWTPDGSQFWGSTETTDDVYIYDAGTPFLATSLVFSASYNLPDNPRPTGMDFRADGSQLWIADDATNSVIAYDLTGTLIGTTYEAKSISFGAVQSAVIAEAANATMEMTAGEALVAGDVCYLESDGKMWKALAEIDTTAQGLILLATEAISADATGTFLQKGSYVTTGLTTGSEYFIDETTSGDWTATKPSITGEIVRLVGYALSTTVLYFDPDKTWVEVP